MIPLYIVSGFLGSGKTTLLNEIIGQAPEGKRLAIVQNEFAPANIDGAVLKSKGGEFAILEVNNGSVFCVCLLGDFANSLASFIDTQQPDLLVLEASGLSDTTAIAGLTGHPLLKNRIFLAANYCVVDAVNFHKVGKMQQRVVHQIRMADRIVINKTDLNSSFSTIEQELRALNPFANIEATSFCRIPFEWDMKPLRRFIPGLQKSLPRPDLQSMVISTTRNLNKSGLIRFLEYWSPKAYRIKGFVLTGKGSKCAVQCTMGQVEVKEVEFWFGPTELIALSDQFTREQWEQSFKNHLSAQN